MTRGVTGTCFHSSRLIRLLSDLSRAEVEEGKQSFAERLGQWLDLTDAISLSSALKASAAPGGGGSPAAVKVALEEECARLRKDLVASITTDGVFTAGKARIKLPVPLPGATMDSGADFSPYHRYYLAHQRDMDGSIGPLRVNVRAALAGLSPSLGRLATLDGVMEQALAARDRSLLATVPLLLERRFEHLRRSHQERLADAVVADNPDLWLQPGGWLALFRQDMQALLLAELDLRLAPVVGLIESLSNETTRHQ